MAVTAASFRLYFPLFATEKDADINRHLNDPWFVGQFNVNNWGGQLERGQMYLLAHMITTEKADRTAGVTATAGDKTYVSRQTVGGAVRVERSVETIKLAMEDPFQRTLYGQRYRALARKAGLGGMVV